MSDTSLNIFVFILILNDLRSPAHLKGYTPCLRLAGNKYQLPTFGINPILSVSKNAVSLEPDVPIISKTPLVDPARPAAECFLCSYDKSGTFKYPTQLNSQSVCV